MNHLDTDELNALFSGGAADGTLAADRIDHLAACDFCAEHLSSVSSFLSAVPAPPMPDDVVARLAAVIEVESDRRASGEATAAEAQQQAAHAKRLSLGTFGDNSPRKGLASKLTPAQPVRSRTN